MKSELLNVQIESYKQFHTGGNVNVEVFNLSNGQSIGGTDEMLAVYETHNAGLDEDDGTDDGELVIDLIVNNPDLIINKNNCYVKAHDKNSFTLNDNTVHRVSDILSITKS